LTSFIGREREVVAVKELLSCSRLLTLTGTGGCGKSRLALRVAADLLEEFEYGVRWIDLTKLADPALVPQAVASALGIYLQSEEHSLESAPPGSIQSRKYLLILDNCEHLIGACTRLAGWLLGAWSNLCIMITSREASGLAGERVWPVPSLRLPDLRHLPPVRELMQYEAIRLFVERATSVLSSFMLTEENASTVAQICHRLDGLPLAIELAAVRLKMLSVEQIAARLNDSCRLLTIGNRTAVPHHQSLRAAIDRSYDLLSEKERTLLQQLSGFAGSFSAETVESVCANGNIARDEIFDLLTHLADASLVIVERENGEAYYRLPETIRQYSRAKLQEETGTRMQTKEQAKLQERTSITKTPPKLTLPREEAFHHTAQIIPASAKAHSELRILALGQIYVYQGEHALTPADWRYVKAKELLFYLLCYHSATKEQIGLALWPDASSPQLRSSFHSALHHLRRALGQPEWIIFKNERYAFDHQLAYWFDVEDFESSIGQAWKLQPQEPTRAIHYLQKGLKLYQGDFLQDNFESDWYQLRRRELQKRHVDALLMLGQLFFAGEQFARAADTYRQVISYDNYLEAAHRELMRCYARLGEQSQAIRHYRTLAELLHDELGAPPAPETTALFEHLRLGKII
jgi:predicted ATPase/DNA-binding SARP family transcriptional activator